VDLVGLRRSLLGPLNSVVGYRDLCDENRPVPRPGRDRLRSRQDRPGHAQPAQRCSSRNRSRALLPRRPSRGPGSAPTVAPFDTRSPAKVTVSPATPTKVQGHILVVDDEPLNREMLVRRLLRMGFYRERRRERARGAGDSRARAV